MVTVSVIAGSPSYIPGRGEVVHTPLVSSQPASVRGMSNSMVSLAVEGGSPAGQALYAVFELAAVIAPSSVHFSVRLGSLEVVSTVMVFAWAGLAVRARAINKATMTAMPKARDLT